MKQKNSQLLFIGISILLLLMILNMVNVFSLQNGLEKKMEEVKELAKPAELQLVSIGVRCSGCMDVDEILEGIKNSGVNITSEENFEFDNEVAKELIEKYGIKKLPTIIVGGEIDKASIQSFTKTGNVLVFNGQKAPYMDAGSGEVVGEVSAIIIDEDSCDECYNFDLAVSNLEQRGVVFENVEKYSHEDLQAQGLIEKYGVLKLPSLLLSEDIEAYPGILQDLQESGLEAIQGYYVLESPVPYVEVSTGKTRGLITLTMVDDKSCEDCYDVNVHKEGLAQLGFIIGKENLVDVNSIDGVKLRVKYDIEKVPTIILTGDVEVYDGFDQIWESIGTIEEDGAYVLRNLGLLGQGILYKDLITNEIAGSELPQGVQ